jgi:hypothetical protein
MARRLACLAHAVAEVRKLSARIESLERPELDRLDELTREVAAQCRSLEAEALAEEEGTP